MNKWLKFILFLLSLVGIFTIWSLLNIVSYGNPTGIGLGDYILMTIGLLVVVLRVGEWFSLL